MQDTAFRVGGDQRSEFVSAATARRGAECWVPHCKSDVVGLSASEAPLSTNLRALSLVASKTQQHSRGHTGSRGGAFATILL